MTGSEIVLNWYHDYYKMNKIVPTAGEIESQLEMAIEEEKRENKSDIIDLVSDCYYEVWNVTNNSLIKSCKYKETAEVYMNVLASLEAKYEIRKISCR